MWFKEIDGRLWGFPILDIFKFYLSFKLIEITLLLQLLVFDEWVTKRIWKRFLLLFNSILSIFK